MFCKINSTVVNIAILRVSSSDFLYCRFGFLESLILFTIMTGHFSSLYADHCRTNSTCATAGHQGKAGQTTQIYHRLAIREHNEPYASLFVRIFYSINCIKFRFWLVADQNSTTIAWQTRETPPSRKEAQTVDGWRFAGGEHRQR